MRKCHLNTCPVGIATQNEELRKLFTGDPDHIVNFFTFLAEDLREIMASLGFRKINEMIGRTDKLMVNEEIEHWKYNELDLTPILHKPQVEEGVGAFKQKDQDFGLESTLDRTLIEVAKPALMTGEKIEAFFPIENINRTVGATLSYEISKLYGSEGLPESTISYTFKGSAGQSFGAFLTKGISFILEGEANDYFGKGLSGANISVFPDKESDIIPEDNIIIGNVAFYGATSGRSFIRGMAGERFCVRNSGVDVVVEGVGDHACEYMTGGTTVILGKTGRNFAAGMSGGTAYVYHPNEREEDFERLCNMSMVGFDDIDQDDERHLKGLIREHFEKTGSKVAEKILEDWKKALKDFIKVMPHDYKAVLMQKKKSLKVA